MKIKEIEGLKKQFEYYKMLAEKTFEQLDDDDLFWKPDAESNSVAVIVNHLSGNMKSRWTDFLTSDGEKEWRNRDREFEEVIGSRQEMINLWNEGWQCLFDALDTIDEDNADTVVYIRNQGHSVWEAIHRQLAHYAYHVGQIVYIGRMVRGGNWKSLSIPKGESGKYNKDKFSEEKSRTHFTDEYLKTSEASEGKVTGMGGIFFKCADPDKIKEWYKNHLGLDTDQYGTGFEWRQAENPSQKGFTQWSPFDASTRYFDPSTKDYMFNYRVNNLDALLQNLQKSGVKILDEIEEYEYGRFVHILDPEGNKIELWEPVDQEYDKILTGRTK